MTSSRLEISASLIQRNVASVRDSLGPDVELIAVVKADAYGMGEGFVTALLQAGVDRFAVANAREGAALRHLSEGAEILVLGGVQDSNARAFLEHRLTAALYDDRQVPPGLQVHVKIDTGMNRLGMAPEAARRRIEALGSRARAVFSHLASAGSDPGLTRLQLQRFVEATAGIGLPRHLSNSAGLAFPEARLEGVRIGLALHGLSQGGALQLAPVMSWKTRVLALREAAAGEAVGYGQTCTLERRSRLAVLPVGYADGYPRAFSNCAVVEVGGRPAPVVGQVSMDLMSVDVTDIDGVQLGDEVTLISAHAGAPHGLETLCAAAGLIPWEVLTVIGERVERRYV